MDLITYGILKKKMEGVTEEVTEAKEAAQQAQAKAEQAQAKAKTSETNAKTAETNAAHSATEAAETVENLNTQFQNAMSALTVDSEVQNIRVGEDGTTYASAGEAVRGQIADLKSQIGEKAPAIMQTVSDQAIASFSDGADDMPLKSLTVAINPVQAGTGDPSPENVRPITGWTGCKVTRTRKNLLAPSTDINTNIQIPNISLSLLANVSEITISTPGLETSFDYRFNTSDMEVILPPGTYCLSTNLSNQTVGNGLFVFNAETGNRLATARLGEGGSFTLTDTTTIRLGLSLSINTASGTYWFQLEKGSTATAYEPYQGNTYDVSWETEAGTVYGGTLDVVNGVLTVDMVTINLGVLRWSYNNDALQFYATLTDLKTGYRAADHYIPLLCDRYANAPIVGSSSVTDRHIGTGTSGGLSSKTIIIMDSAYTDANSFNTAMMDLGVQLVYELGEPQTYQLTPVDVKTLLGQNNIFADTGDVSVEYTADTKTYIDNQIAAMQALVLENITNS